MEEEGKKEKSEGFPKGRGWFQLLLLQRGAGVMEVVIEAVVVMMVVLLEERGAGVEAEECTAGGLGGERTRFFLAPMQQQCRARIPVRAGGSPDRFFAPDARRVSLEMVG